MKKIIIGVLLVGLFLGLVSAESFAEIKKKSFVCNQKTALTEGSRKAKTSGQFNVAILMVYPQGGSPPEWGEEDLKELFSESKYSPKNFFKENSKGKLEMNFQYFGWGELPHDMDYYSDTALGVGEGAVLLFDDEIDWREYSGIFLIINDPDYYNLSASVGPSFPYDTNDGEVYLAEVIASHGLFDGYEDVGATDNGFVTSIPKEESGEYYIRWVCWHLAHELGHCLGLRHSLGWRIIEESGCLSCDKLNDPENSSDCEIKDYGGLSVMGTGTFYLNLSPQEKLQLGWISEEEVIEVKTDYTLWLSQRNAESGDRYLKIPAGLNSGGTMTYFFVEYLTPVGDFDGTFFGYDDRVVVVTYWPGGKVLGEGDPYRMGTLLTYFKKTIYHGDYSDAEGWNPVLYGSTTTWCDPRRGVTIDLLRETGDEPEDAQAEMKISFTCPEEPYYMSASLEVDNGTETIHQGEMVSVPVELITRDSVGMSLDCGPVFCSFGVDAPEGWEASLDKWSASLNAGDSENFNLHFSVPSDATSGTYDITVKCSDDTGSFSVKKTLSYTVKKKANFSINGTGSESSKMLRVKRGNRVELTVYVKNLDTEEIVEEAEFRCWLKKPNGKTVKLVDYPKDGKTTFHYRVKKSDPLGVYTLYVTVEVPEHDGFESWSTEKELYFKVIESKSGKKVAVLADHK